jgi:hypothetical protein
VDLARDGERASQAVEFALVLPAVLLFALLLVHTAVLAGESVAAQALAAQAARAAAVDGPEAARAAVGRGAPAGTAVHVRRAPGVVDAADWYAVELRVPSRAFRMLGLRLHVQGRAHARAQ